MMSKMLKKAKVLYLLGLVLIGLTTWMWMKHRSADSVRRIRPNQGTSSIKKYNRLGEEKSPYLLQHKDNPVHWFSWGEDAFRAAREENKLIFLSVGYSTCYWCHMMEKDSFEKQEVADAMNRDYISIKVDREEHPDVDQIYMDAVLRMAGQGGWAMTGMLTPDLKPFFGGTFFWRIQLLQLLSTIQDVWQSNPEKILNSGEKMATLLKEENNPPGNKALNIDLLRKSFQQFQKSFDENDGGFGGAPKFPHSQNLSLLLRIYRRTGNQEALKIVTQSLDAMAHGGIYDHLGGGFHRYSTDKKWFAPHFEKMLYDNTQLAITYLEAFQVTQKKEYAEVARGILNYVLREMTDPQGGFYSAQDAGEVGKEGEYYLWKESELKQALLPEEFQIFKKVYGMNPQGNFQKGENILFLFPEQTTEISDIKNNPLLQSAQKKLLTLRQTRPSPHQDDKILTSWNGLMIAAMARGYQVLGDISYLDAAKKSAEFIHQHLMQNGKLLRRYRDGESRYFGTLDDYAFLIYGLIELYESTFDTQWINWAQELQTKQDEFFWDDRGGYFFTDNSDKSLLLRKKEMEEGSLPSGNSIALLNLLHLEDLTFAPSYQKKVEKLLDFFSGSLNSYPSAFPQVLIALDYHLDRAKEIAVIQNPSQDDTDAIRQYLYKAFLPNKVVAIGNEIPLESPQGLSILKGKKVLNQKTTLYVCEKNLCKLPTSDLEKAKILMNDFEKYNLF